MKDLKILYEDDDILVVDKPAGLVVHSDGRTKEPSVAEWFVEKYPQVKDVGEPIVLTSPNPLLDLGEGGRSPGEVRRIERPGIVHRIDRETSGVLLLAKTSLGFECLKTQFQNREVKKTYHLFVHGLVKDDRGTINLSIGKSTSDFRKWSAQRGKKGVLRDALTYFEVLKRLPAQAGSPELGVTFVEAKPQTGRTHQIRVHFQALQYPVIGDPLYAGGKPRLLDFTRLALHARKVTFKNVKGEEIAIEAPYPEDFQKALKKLDF